MVGSFCPFSLGVQGIEAGRSVAGSGTKLKTMIILNLSHPVLHVPAIDDSPFDRMAAWLKMRNLKASKHSKEKKTGDPGV